jgi:hypothetical protein
MNNQAAPSRRYITLPEHDDMLNQLTTAYPDPAIAVLFPYLTAHLAGRTLVAAGIAHACLRAASDAFFLGRPAWLAFLCLLPGFITALIDEPDVRTEAISILTTTFT